MSRSLLQRLLGRARSREAESERLYRAIVEQARAPGFYRDCGVPDSLDGRFELLVLHVALVLQRLRRLGPAGQALAQGVFDALVANLDVNLREMGVGDMGVPPRVKRMAQAYYGRAKAYESALAGAEPLEAALRRNLYGTAAAEPDRLRAMADYVRRQRDGLEAADPDALLDGRLGFVALPERVERD
jgi:cytochrome b pre-mRNA-processing protein 3